MPRPSATLVAASLAVLTIAGCTSFKTCAYEGFGRDGWQQPEHVIEALGIEPGDHVADLGSGSGYFTLRLARAVGPQGKVYAVDVDEEMNERLGQRLRVAGVDNVEVLRGEFDDPLLPDGRIDLLFTSNTYHHIESRVDYFRAVRADLAPAGRVAVLDYDGRRGWFVKLQRHFTPKQTLLSEMQEAGYAVDQDLDFLDRQSFVIFRPADAP